MGFQSERVYEAYWIREPHHTDMTKEGYIGITCKGVDRRFNEHCWTAEKGEGWTLQEKIRNLGRENLTVTTICIGSFDYIKELELKLRPYPYIGWNHAKGGGGHTPEFASERQKKTAKKMKENGTDKIRVEKYKNSMQKYWSDPEFIQKRNESLAESWKGPDAEDRRKKASDVGKNNWKDPVIRERMLKSMRETMDTEEYHQKMTESANKKWADPDFREKQRKGASKSALKRYSENPFWKHPSANLATIKVADKAYDIWSSNNGCGHRKIEKALGFKEYAFDHMVRRFRGGWNPLEDDRWLEDFKGEPNE